jgi:hypothetical protein
MVKAMPPRMRGRRRTVLWFGLVTCVGVLAQVGSGLPVLNLLVELRQTDELSGSSQSAGLSGGAVVLGSDGQVSSS